MGIIRRRRYAKEIGPRCLVKVRLVSVRLFSVSRFRIIGLAVNEHSIITKRCRLRLESNFWHYSQIHTWHFMVRVTCESSVCATAFRAISHSHCLKITMTLSTERWLIAKRFTSNVIINLIIRQMQMMIYVIALWRQTKLDMKFYWQAYWERLKFWIEVYNLQSYYLLLK